jgi:hypothetical protein
MGLILALRLIVARQFSRFAYRIGKRGKTGGSGRLSTATMMPMQNRCQP